MVGFFIHFSVYFRWKVSSEAFNMLYLCKENPESSTLQCRIELLAHLTFVSFGVMGKLSVNEFIFVCFLKQSNQKHKAVFTYQNIEQNI